MISNREFIDAMFSDLPEGAAPVVCAFPGDPNNPPEFAWAAKPALWRLRPPALVRDDLNSYVGVASFFRSTDGRYRRRKAAFAALHAIMIDDLGTGLGAKAPMDRLAMPATALVETSPSNFQAYLRLDPVVTDRRVAESLIEALIYQGLAAKADPGMAGVTRVGRLPVGINGKPKHGGWRVRVSTWAPERAYSAQEIANGFGLTVRAKARKQRAVSRVHIAEGFYPYASPARDLVYRALVREGLISPLIQLPEARAPGDVDAVWVPMTCPWIEEHTDRADTGTAYMMGGGFYCHHGHCSGRNLGALIEWLGKHGHDSKGLTLQMRAERRRQQHDFVRDVIWAEGRKAMEKWHG